MDPETPPGPDPHGPSHNGPSPFGGPSVAGPSATGHPEESLPDEGGTAGPSPTGHPDDPLPVDETTAAEVEEIGDVDALDVLAATAKERDEYLDALKRLQADFDNYRKRVQRHQSEASARAGEDLASKLLPVLDTIDLARQHGAGEGVEQIAAALFEVLAREGLERIDPVGEAFDPNEHEAVSHEPAGAEDDDPGPVVSGLMRAGYRWKGRLVRAAMVTVRG